jgi:oligopeptide/dipeptide ABC transporter ATP-binding protein
VLRVRELSVCFQTERAAFLALDRVSFDLERGGSLALIGESGSGKSTAALALLGLVPKEGRATGSIELDGEELRAERDWERVRGRKVAMIFSDPLAALNPVLRIGTQLAECGSREETARLLRRVGLDASVAALYPHQLSGGMRQRALIAMAVAGGPSLLLADEPTSALDAVSQAAVVALLGELCRERRIALVLATHDLSLAARLCRQVAVLYAGRIVERAEAAELFARPRHPYSEALLRSQPPPLGESRARLEPVPGSPPAPWARPSGCRFRDRCARARLDCAEREPLLPEFVDGGVACLHPVEAA